MRGGTGRRAGRGPRSTDDASAARAQLGLRADCARCFGLCCVAPAFTASADFAIDKPAGQPCPHLRPDFRCGIHGTRLTAPLARPAHWSRRPDKSNT